MLCLRPVFPPLLCAALLACGSDPPSSSSAGLTSSGTSETGNEASTSQPSTSAGASSTGEPLPEIDWGECPVGFNTECAYIQVPLDRDDPTSISIPVMISRRPAPSGTTNAQIWLMQGGPGGSADAFSLIGMHDQLNEVLPNVDVYTIEHRGVGESARLDCVGNPLSTPDLIQECADLLQNATDGALGSFSTSEAAQDLQYMLELAWTPDQQQFIYGVSYGSYWAMRFLELFPDEVDGVVLDSVAVPTQKFSDYDEQADPVGQRLAARCAKDAICSAKMGADPWLGLSEAIAALEGGQCSQSGVTGDTTARLMWGLLADRGLRELIMPLAYRLQRCSLADLAAVSFMFEALQTYGPQQPPGTPLRFSQLLQSNIAVAEFWRYPYDPAELESACQDAVLCPGLSAGIVPFADVWPRYGEPLVDQWPTSATPILAFNGDMDPQTPIETASLIADHLSGPHQNFYEFPEAPHGIAFATPVNTAGAPTCGAQMLRDFVLDPSQPPGTSCLEDLVPLEVAGGAEQAMQFFGTADMWENAAKAPPKQGRLRTPADWRGLVERLQQRAL